MMYRDGRLIVNGIGDRIRRLSLLIYCRFTQLMKACISTITHGLYQISHKIVAIH